MKILYPTLLRSHHPMAYALIGQAPAHKYIYQLLKYVEEGKVKPDDIITHRLSLSQIVHGYKIFKEKQEDCVKVVLNPWAA